MIDLIFDILPQIHGGGQEGISPAKGLEAFLTFLEKMTTLSPAEIFRTLLPGIATLPNIHPLLVHFPIVFFISFFFADVLGGMLHKIHWRNFATAALYLGTVSAMLTVAAGLQAAYSVPHNDASHAVMLRHQSFGISVLVLAVLLSIRRFFASEDFLSKQTYGHYSLSTLLVILLSLGADLGGFMVYHHGVSVTPVMQQQQILYVPAPVHSYQAPTHSHDGHSHSHAH